MNRLSIAPVVTLAADKDHPQLSPELFRKGDRLAPLLTRDKEFGRNGDSGDAGIETFRSPDENGGAAVAEAERLEIIRRVLNTGGRNGNN